MSLLLEILVPTPKDRVEVDHYGHWSIIQQGKQPEKLGKIRPDIADEWSGIIAYANIVGVSLVGLGKNGKETDESRKYRALQPLRNLKDKIIPPRLSPVKFFSAITGKKRRFR